MWWSPSAHAYSHLLLRGCSCRLLLILLVLHLLLLLLPPLPSRHCASPLALRLRHVTCAVPTTARVALKGRL